MKCKACGKKITGIPFRGNVKTYLFGLIMLFDSYCSKKCKDGKVDIVKSEMDNALINYKNNTYSLEEAEAKILTTIMNDFERRITEAKK